MAYSNEWLCFRKSEDEYFTYRQAFMQNAEAMVNDLKKALTIASDRETALRFLAEMKPSATIIVPLLSEIMDAVIDSSNLTTIGLAKNILYNYKDYFLIKKAIQTSVANYLVNNDEWHYRRIAELYELLNYKEELASFVLLCKVSNNWEIREIGDDFNHVK